MDDKDKGSQGDEPRSKRVELSFAQVAGSAVAAVVAAVCAGQLNVYGTFLGAGVVSVVATTGGPLFQHFFRRTGEELRVKTSQAAPKVRQITVSDRDGAYRNVTVTTLGEAEESGQATQLIPVPGSESGTHPAVETDRMPVAGVGQPPAADAAADPGGVPEVAEGATKPPASNPASGSEGAVSADGGAVQDGEPTRQLGLAADRTQLVSTGEVTRMLAQPGTAAESGAGGAAGPAEAADAAADWCDEAAADTYTDGTTHGTKWRGWKRTLLPAALIFVISVGGITVFELISGDRVGGGQGTSISGVFHGGSGGHDPSEDGNTGPQSGSSDGDNESTESDHGAGGASQESGGNGTDSDGATDGDAGDGGTGVGRSGTGSTDTGGSGGSSTDGGSSTSGDTGTSGGDTGSGGTDGTSGASGGQQGGSDTGSTTGDANGGDTGGTSGGSSGGESGSSTGTSGGGSSSSDGGAADTGGGAAQNGQPGGDGSALREAPTTG